MNLIPVNPWQDTTRPGTERIACFFEELRYNQTLRDSVNEYLQARIRIINDTSCHNWIGPFDRKGIPRMKFQNMRISPIRTIAVLAGIELDPTRPCRQFRRMCGNVYCVNLEHMTVS
jgi:hypothetical protein